MKDFVTDLLSFLRPVLPAASRDVTRSHLNGVMLERLPGDDIGVRAVATDGHRLHVLEGAHIGVDAQSIWSSFPPTLILPLWGLKLAADAARRDDRARYTLSGAGLALHARGFQAQIDRVTADFTPWQRVMPTSWSATATVSRAAIRKAIARVTPDANGGIIVRVRADVDGVDGPDTGRVWIESGRGVGSGDDHAIPIDGRIEMLDRCKVPDGVGVSRAYLDDATRGCAGDKRAELTLSIGRDELDPIGVGDGHGYRAIVMPMRIERRPR